MNENGNNQAKGGRRATVSLAEAADIIGVCKRTIERAIQAKEIASIRVRGRHLIPRTELDRLLNPTAGA